jgi:hypothetical protein
MAAADHRVYFSFTLPTAMMLSVPSGLWDHTPRGCSIEVAAGGDVQVTSVDHSEVYARNQALQTTLRFLKSLPRLQIPETVTAELSAPSCRSRPERYAITLDAKVSIADTRWKPMVA